MRKYVLVLVLSVIAVFALRPVSAFTEMPAVGNAAPTFKLTTNEGTPASLSDFKGNGLSFIFTQRTLPADARLRRTTFNGTSINTQPLMP